VLVGTISIETSEMLAKKLKKRGVKHNVLNAKQHEREADIVAQAGRFGAVTISTNMAGRGTDIVLGGNPEFLALDKCGHDKDHPEFQQRLAEFEAQCFDERAQVVEAGGLHILGTERHESRRIDNQLRGRAGRQGDAGSSQFFLSLEDDLLRIFESERVAQWWDRVGVEEGEAIENKLLSRVIENAQTKVEARNFDIRKHLLDYDDVMNKQRQAFYARRREVLAHDDVHEELGSMIEHAIVSVLDAHWPEKGAPDQENLDEMALGLQVAFGLSFDPTTVPFVVDGKPRDDYDALAREILDGVSVVIEEKKKSCDALAAEHVEVGYPSFAQLERDLMLQILDTQWKDHLHTMDGLREGINLRGYAQRDPKLEYQREGYDLFEDMNQRLDQQTVEVAFKFALPEPVRIGMSQRGPAPTLRRPPPGPPPPGGAGPGAPDRAGPDAGEKVGRNAPCPCGSGKKFKKCHGA
jgi:preprotein translocase subunit SecA